MNISAVPSDEEGRSLVFAYQPRRLSASCAMSRDNIIFFELSSHPSYPSFEQKRREVEAVKKHIVQTIPLVPNYAEGQSICLKRLIIMLSWRSPDDTVQSCRATLKANHVNGTIGHRHQAFGPVHNGIEQPLSII